MKYKEIENIEVLKQFIRGSLLGDGSIPRLGLLSANAHLKFGHSESQLFYIIKKQEFLSKFGLANKLIKWVDISSRYKNGSCTSYHLKSKTHPLFTLYRDLYYPTGIKSINKEDINKIDGFGLSIWFMDDAHLWKLKGKTSTYLINTQSFLVEDIEHLIKLLSTKFNIKSSLLSSGEIRISTKSIYVFNQLIKPYILSGFNYKLNEGSV